MPTTVFSENWDGVTAPAMPSNWVQPATIAQLFTEATNPFSSPNTLTRGPSDSGLSQTGWNSVSGVLRDCIVSSYFTIDSSLSSGHTNFLLIARLSGADGAAQLLDTGTAYYCYFIFNSDGTSGVGLDKNVSGSDTNLVAPQTWSAFTTGVYYRGILTCNGTAITVQVQRQTDNKWLDDTGTWVVDPGGTTACISTTDSSISTPGYAAVGMYSSAAPGTGVRHDNFELQSFAGPLTAGTCYVQRNSDTSLKINSTPTIQGTPNYSYQLQRSTDGISFSNLGSAQTNVPPNTQPTQVIDTGLTTGTPYYYQWVVTDSAGSPASVTTNVASLAPRSTGQTYYITTAGSDSNNGTSPSTPWQTLAHAQAFGLTEGDTLLLNGGDTFTGSMIFYWVAGTYAAPVAISSYGVGIPIISCGNSYAIRMVRCSGIKLSNIKAVGSGASSSGVSTSLYNGFEIINPDGTGELAQVWLDNLEVTGCYSGIEVRGSAATGSVGGSGFSDIRITNCYSHEILYFGMQIRCIVLLSSTGETLTWDTFSLVDDRASAANNYQLFAGIANTGAYIGNCRVLHSYGDPARDDSTHSGDGIMMKETQHGLIERSSAFDCGAHGDSPAGIWLQEDNDCRIRYCEVARQSSKVAIDGDGFDMDGGCVNCAVEYCYSHDNRGADCLCGPYPGSSPPSGCMIRYNVFVNSAVDSNANALIYPYGTAQVDIYNNTLYADDSSTNIAALIVHGGGRQRMWNNIFITDRSDALPFVSGTFDNGSLAIGNCYFALGSGGPKWNWNGVDYTTFAAFVSGAGQETLNGVTVGQYANPLLVAAGNHDDEMPTNPVSFQGSYKQTDTSPTINQGVDLLTYYGIDVGTIDFRGYPNRNGLVTGVEADLTHSGFDQGADKFGSQGLIPPGSIGSGRGPKLLLVGCS